MVTVRSHLQTPVFTKTYDEDGDYEVTLTVTDDDGATGTETKTVTVEAVDEELEAPSIASFTATPNPAAVDDDVELAWEIDGEVTTLDVTDLERRCVQKFSRR